eukprot:5220782-Amphidinium_carterae.1
MLHPGCLKISRVQFGLVQSQRQVCAARRLFNPYLNWCFGSKGPGPHVANAVKWEGWSLGLPPQPCSVLCGVVL